MGIKRCENGHFFDDNLHEICPYCKGNEKSNFIDRTPSTVKKLIEQEKINNSIYKDAQIISPKNHINSIDSNEQITIEKDYTANNISRDKNEQKTIAKQKILINDINEQLTEAHEKQDSKTVGTEKKKLGMDPVVGWLVCVKGSERGRDFRLHLGKNFVGRSLAMDIAITSEKGIASVNHTCIIYETKKNRFLLISLGGTPTYLNGELVIKSIDLKDYDRISVGETEFDFISYCKGDIKWRKE